MFTEDLSQFFDEQTGFAVRARFTRGAVEVATASVIFSDPSQSVEIYAVDLEESAPTLLAPTAPLAAVKRKDTVAVNGATYSVERLRPDGTGITTVYLAEQ